MIVQILTKETRVLADKNYDVECRTSGSRPEAVITWWKANKAIMKTAQTVSSLYIACKKCVKEQKTKIDIIQKKETKEGNHLNAGGRANILSYLIKSSSLALFI